MIFNYVLKYHLADCLELLSNHDKLGYFSLKIDFMNLFETYPDVGDKVLCSPVETLPLCDQDIIKSQQYILENEEYTVQLSKLSHHSLKRNVHARFFGLPVCPELHRTVFPKNFDLGCFLKVTGTVVRVTQAKMLEYHRKYVCMKCKYENYQEAKFEDRFVLKAPTKCANNEKRCKCTTFTQVNLISREHCEDYQEIKLQEQVNKLSIGTIPGSLWVVLENDLVDSCKPGDDVHICGAVRRRWRPSSLNKKCEVELVLHANYLEVCNAQRSEVIAKAPDIKECFDEYWSKFEECPLKGRDQILNSVCPQVYGLHLVKLALLLTVITGSNHISDSEMEKKSVVEEREATRVRGQCHLLLVGDPGTGKSQLLRAGADLTPRSVFTSGTGSTRAGLTCSALREDGEWQLEAGALVLSDGGVCCIDEIGQLREHDRASIHEAMEQQTISIAKAGIVCKLNTRCAVIAACNPKGHYQCDQPLSVNVSLGTPLLSRFDLIFILLDSKNKAWDKLVSSYILVGGSNNIDPKRKWTLEKLQMYIGLVGPRCTSMTRSANIILQTYYMTQRKSDYRDPSRTTVRMLDSLVRLSQAHCRLMYRATILPMDAIVAVTLVDLSMQDCTMSDTVDALHSTIPKYPDFDYLCTAKKLLTRLNLFEIWQEELLYYGKVLQVDHKTLDSDIDKENSGLFAKFEDVLDDNVPLSSTLVTSSYFNKKDTKEQFVADFVNDTEKRNSNFGKAVNEKLAATLKKHATLNQEDKKPPSNQKFKGKKRKRKEVVVDTKAFEHTKNKKVKNLKRLVRDKNSSESEPEVDCADMLKAVPSVNDEFSELGIDLHFSTMKQEENHVNKSENTKVTGQQQGNLRELERSKLIVKTESCVNISDNIKTSKGEKVSSTLSKLQAFKFIEKRDVSIIYEENVENKKEPVVKLENVSKLSDVSVEHLSKKASVSSSQISIFESSDCDIDLDL